MILFHVFNKSILFVIILFYMLVVGVEKRIESEATDLFENRTRPRRVANARDSSSGVSRRSEFFLFFVIVLDRFLFI